MTKDADLVALHESAHRQLALMGSRIRTRRKDRGMTLQDLAGATGLSPSMLSLIERGRASPSIGSLIVLSDVLQVAMSDLLEQLGPPDARVVRGRDVEPVRSLPHVTRKVMKEDAVNGISIAVNEYAASGASNESALAHDGHEYGLLLSGTLTIEVEGDRIVIAPGDLVSYSSRRPHRIFNHGKDIARTVWINTNRK